LTSQSHTDVISQPAPAAGGGKSLRVFDSLEILLLIAVIACAVFTLLRAFIRIQLPFQIDYAEGAILNSSWRAAQGGGLYQPLKGIPYQIDPYPPFIYKVVGWVLARTGLNFFYPRLLAFAAPVLACLLAAILIHHWTQRWRVAVAFGFLPLSVVAVQSWLGIIRFDFIGIALAMAGLVIFALFPRYRFWSLPFFAVAVGGLYTLVAAPGACCLHLWLKQERKKSMLFGACLAGALLAGVLYGQHTSSGWMNYHLFKTQHSPYSISQLASYSQGLLRGYALLMLLSAVVIWKSIREHQVGLVALYWFLVLGTSLSLGKIGAAQNHVLQLIFAASLSAAVGYAWMRRKASGDSGLALILLTLTLTTASNVPLRPRKPMEDVSECGRAYSTVRNDLGDRILSDNVGALVLARKPVFVSDPFVYRWMVAGTRFPDGDLRRMIDSREFTAIVLNHEAEGSITDDDRWPDDIRQTISRNYLLKEEFTCKDARFVYQPKSDVSSFPEKPPTTKQ